MDGCDVSDCLTERRFAEKGECLNIGFAQYTKIAHCESADDFTVKVCDTVNKVKF